MTSKINYDDIIKKQPTINIGCLGSVMDGKCFGIGTEIMMYNNSIKKVENIIKGDIIMGDDYQPRNVLNIVRGTDQLYEVVQESNKNYVVNSKHILCLIKKNQNNIITISVTDYLKMENNKKKDLMGYSVNIVNNKFIYKNTTEINIIEKDYGKYYGFTIDGNNQFLLADSTVTHNSSMVNTLCNVKTQKHSSEHLRNITIKLGYANAKIFKCPICPEPDCFDSTSSKITKMYCKNCKERNNEKVEMTLIKHISFVDCPGHNDLLLTMLSGVNVMDHSIIVISAAEDIQSKRQLKEHVTAAGISNLNKYIVCLNKLDLINKETVLSRYDDLIEYLNDTPIKNSPIIPTSFNRGLNKKELLKHIVSNLENPKRDLDSSPSFRVTRSFDINKPGTSPININGGVIGGTLLQGVLKVNDIIELRPGIIKRVQSKIVYKPIITTIRSIKSENNSLSLAIPGGLIAIGTDIDSYYTKNDSAVGNTCGHPGTLPPVYTDIILEFISLEKYFDDNNISIKLNEMVLVNCNSISIAGKVLSINDNKIKINLIGKLLCLEKNDTIILSRKLKEGCKIIGKGIFIDGIQAERFK
jgi:translation initiation factor 2 subunit 3